MIIYLLDLILNLNSLLFQKLRDWQNKSISDCYFTSTALGRPRCKSQEKQAEHGAEFILSETWHTHYSPGITAAGINVASSYELQSHEQEIRVEKHLQAILS